VQRKAQRKEVLVQVIGEPLLQRIMAQAGWG
jgi:hypothetical protein